jgi:transposase
MTPIILPNLWQNGLRTTYWGGHTQSPDLSPIENVWAVLKKGVRSRRPKNLSQLHQLCQAEWAKILTTYFGKLVDGYLKRLTQVKQFKGNPTEF